MRSNVVYYLGLILWKFAAFDGQKPFPLALLEHADVPFLLYILSFVASIEARN